jgi:hypothetical protein
MIEIIENPPKGEWMHPELKTLFGERKEISDAEFKSWCGKAGIQTFGVQPPTINLLGS